MYVSKSVGDLLLQCIPGETPLHQLWPRRGELQVTIAVLQFLTFNAVGTEMVLRGPHSGGMFARPTCGQEPWHGHGVMPIS